MSYWGETSRLVSELVSTGTGPIRIRTGFACRWTIGWFSNARTEADGPACDLSQLPFATSSKRLAPFLKRQAARSIHGCMKPSIALAILLAATPARSEEFRRFADGQLEIDVPRDWDTRWINGQAFFMSTRANSGGPGLLIEIKRYGERLDPSAMADSVRKSLGGTFRVTERTESNSIFERTDPPTRIAAGFYPDPQRRFTVLAIYWARFDDWEAGGGRALVDRVAASVNRPAGARIVERTLGYAGPSASSPGTDSTSTRLSRSTGFEGDPSLAAAVTPENIAGTWRNTSLDSHMDTGRLDYSAEGGAIEITFSADNTFQIDYKKSLISGVFRSETQVSETGRFELVGGQLTLHPEAQRGWISVMNGRRESADKSGSPSRSYKAGAHQRFILLTGHCAPYQVDLGCGADRSGRKRQLTFVFERAR